jgi:hypothetical protein
MKSHLEARWARFFDALDIAWEYEHKRFEMDGQRYPYRPDFHLPDHAVIVEVKPHPVTDPELVGKYAAYGPELVRRGECRLFVFCIGRPRPEVNYAAYWGHGERTYSFTRAFGDLAVRLACSSSDHMRFEASPVPAFGDGSCARFADMDPEEVRQDPEFVGAWEEYLRRNGRTS